MKKLFKEFKKFISKGNVLDLAVAVIIGTAFGKIVTSLVNDIIMPFISLIIGGKNFGELKWVLVKASETKQEIAIFYGSFIQSLIDFLIIAICIFIIIKILTSMQKNIEKLNKKRKEGEQQENIEEKTEQKVEVIEKDIELLTEIRDLLKAKEEIKD